MKTSLLWTRFGRRRRADKQRSIFLSRPTAATTQQEAFSRELNALLEGEGVVAHTLGITEYPSKAPLGEVLDLLRRCDGALVLGLAQVNVETGVSKQGTTREARIDGSRFGTPWNQIEAGMAFALGLPLLLIRESGVTGGVFDAGSSDRFVHQAQLTPEWLASQAFQQPFHRWLDDVRTRR